MAQKQKKLEVITKISINFPKELWKDLKRRAVEDEETVTDILVRLASGYVQKRAANRRKTM